MCFPIFQYKYISPLNSEDACHSIKSEQIWICWLFICFRYGSRLSSVELGEAERSFLSLPPVPNITFCRPNLDDFEAKINSYKVWTNRTNSYEGLKPLWKQKPWRIEAPEELKPLKNLIPKRIETPNNWNLWKMEVPQAFLAYKW